MRHNLWQFRKWYSSACCVSGIERGVADVYTSRGHVGVDEIISPIKYYIRRRSSFTTRGGFGAFVPILHANFTVNTLNSNEFMYIIYDWDECVHIKIMFNSYTMKISFTIKALPSYVWCYEIINLCLHILVKNFTFWWIWNMFNMTLTLF